MPYTASKVFMKHLKATGRASSPPGNTSMLSSEHEICSLVSFFLMCSSGSVVESGSADPVHTGFIAIENKNFCLFLLLIFAFLDPYPADQSVLRIRDPVLFWPREPGWKKSGFGIRDEHSGFYFEYLESVFWAKNTKIL
jgi:hypothetical protein